MCVMTASHEWSWSKTMIVCRMWLLQMTITEEDDCDILHFWSVLCRICFSFGASSPRNQFECKMIHSRVEMHRKSPTKIRFFFKVTWPLQMNEDGERRSSHVGYDSFIYATWSYLWHDSFYLWHVSFRGQSDEHLVYLGLAVHQKSPTE